eukprot:CAMPEP_0196226388 /NCGR_PEP_ID=MMETSP0912-20130531/50375_1 /TAXON_ID=49265 /ORGANISM="Thalassiosira rotula, Strain GSO102" /LENGTH=186 /DNA_ID=CAMNT_0041505885 /DNA_START=515 /DNA_END=1075 /DNA_ORIENTATION=+
MKAANSLVSNKVLDGHIDIAVPLSQENVMCYPSQFSVIESSNATAGTGEHSNGICTCLCCYGSGALTGIVSGIGCYFPGLLAGPFRYYTLTLGPVSLSLAVLLLFWVPSKRYFLNALQYIIETDSGLRWFGFGFFSAQDFTVATYLDRGNWVSMGLFMLIRAFQGWLLLETVHVESVEDTDTMEDN